MNRLRRSGSWALDHPWPVLLTVLVAAAALFYFTRGDSPHTLRAAFSYAINVSPGQPAQIDGVRVGKVNKIQERDGLALVEIGIDKEWPLPQGTQAVLRWGSQLCQGCRYVQLLPGPDDAPDLRENAIVPEKDSLAAVEFDDLFNTFDDATRESVRGTAGGVADATDGQSEEIGTSLEGSGSALEAASGLLGDLDRDRRALSEAVTQTAGATRTIASRRPVLEDLLDAAAVTFTEFGTRQDEIRASLDQFAPALAETRTTLGRLDGSLDTLDGLVADLAPGLEATRPLIREARPALAGLRQLAPLGVDTLRTLSAAAPDTTALLRRAQPFSDQFRRTLGGFVEPVSCLRPYAPEIAAFVTQWGSWAQNYDQASHYGRVKGNSGQTSPTNYGPVDTDTFLAIAPGIKSALLRPPGFNAGQPWYQPQCGVGEDAVDPAQDPEDS